MTESLILNIIKDYYNFKANNREMSMGQSSLLVQLSNSNESLKIQQIVISSSWKSLGLAKLQELWMKRNLPGRVIDITPAPPDNDKGKKIAEWLSKYGIHDTRYVIIDDEEVTLGSQVPYFIWTNPYEGLTEEQADIAIRILSL